MVRIAFLNLIRRKGKSITTICIMLLVIFLLTAMIASLMPTGESISLEEKRVGVDVLIYPQNTEIDDKELLYTGISQMKYMDADVIDGKLNTEDIESITPQFFIETKPGAGCCSASQTYRIVGIEQDSDFVLSAWMNQYDVSDFGKGNIIIGSNIGKDFGSQTFLLNDLVSVSGVLYPTGTGMDESIFIDIDYARELGAKSFDMRAFGGKDPNKIVSCYLVKLKENVDVDQFVADAEQQGLQASIQSISNTNKQLKQQISELMTLFLFLGIFCFILGEIALFVHFSNSIADRKQEIGYLRAIGFSRGQVASAFLIEMMSAGAIGALIGAILGVIVSEMVIRLIQNILSITIYTLDPFKGVVFCLMGVVLSLITCLIVVIIPVVKISFLEPYIAITEGEI